MRSWSLVAAAVADPIWVAVAALVVWFTTEAKLLALHRDSIFLVPLRSLLVLVEMVRQQVLVKFEAVTAVIPHLVPSRPLVVVAVLLLTIIRVHPLEMVALVAVLRVVAVEMAALEELELPGKVMQVVSREASGIQAAAAVLAELVVRTQPLVAPRLNSRHGKNPIRIVVGSRES